MGIHRWSALFLQTTLKSSASLYRSLFIIVVVIDSCWTLNWSASSFRFYTVYVVYNFPGIAFQFGICWICLDLCSRLDLCLVLFLFFLQVGLVWIFAPGWICLDFYSRLELTFPSLQASLESAWLEPPGDNKSLSQAFDSATFRAGDTLLIEAMLEAGGDVDQRDLRGETAFQVGKWPRNAFFFREESKCLVEITRVCSSGC